MSLVAIKLLVIEFVQGTEPLYLILPPRNVIITAFWFLKGAGKTIGKWDLSTLYHKMIDAVVVRIRF